MGYPDVLAVNSIADIVADTEMIQQGVRTPCQERVDEILSSRQSTGGNWHDAGHQAHLDLYRSADYP